MTLQQLFDVGVLPVVVAEELLQGADGTATGKGDRLDALAFQVGEQTAAVAVQVAEGLGVAAAVQVRPQEVLQRRPQPVELFLGHCSCLLPGLLLSYIFIDRLSVPRSAVLITPANTS